jgi:predicted ATPase/DNA-binding SARP family transcriptional activator
MAAGTLRLLGAPAFEEGATVLRFAPERVFQVIAYLACKGDWVQRGVLAALLYGDLPEESARRNLRKLLLRAREFDWFARSCEATRDSMRLQIGTDVQALLAAWREKRSTTVVGLYRGRLLEGLDAPECRGYTDWLETERQRLHSHWRDAVLAVLADASTRDAIELSGRLIAADALDEGALRAHLTALAADGQIVQAQRAYRGYAAQLASELGVEPSVELRAMFEAFAPESRAQSVRAAATTRASSDDTFIGRVAELQQIAALLAQDGCRLLNLVGPGGVGKSSLARQAMHALDEAMAGNVRFIPFEDVAAASEIGARLARHLDIRLAANTEPLEQVARALRDARWLLVLDNLEHLAAEAGVLTQLLESCPHLTLLVTSRSRLAIPHEWLLPLEGLPYPAPEDDERADAFDAVRLFIRAARRVRPAFAPAAERAALVEICREVEGLPLALEITAAWTRVLGCAAIVAELRRGTELLRTADAARPLRQASMEAVFEHSWRLLAPVEREALARLSVFRSDVSRETARAVTGASLPVFAALADKSLLRILPQDRCSLHPLVHAFARDRLQQDGTAVREVTLRHAEHYCAMLAAHVGMEAVDQQELLERITPELADAVAALTWARAQNRWDLVGPAALVLSQIFELLGRPRDGLAALGEPIYLSAPSTRVQARAQGQFAIGYAALLTRLTQFAAASQSAEQGLRAFRAAADAEGVRMALSILSTTSLKLGRHADSRRYCQHGLRASERANDRIGIATFLNNLGLVNGELGRWDAAIDHYERALAVNRAVTNQVGVIAQLNNLAHAHIGAGRHEQARTLLFEGLRLVDAAGFGALRPYFLANLAQASLELGRTEEARAFADEGLSMARAAADMTNAPGLLLVLGDLALGTARFDEAQSLVREAAQVTRSTQHRRWLVRSLMAQARVLRACGDSDGARRIVRAIQASPTATPVEVADARAVAQQLAPATADTDLLDESIKPSLEQLLAEIADGVPAR